jgi:hypothetical protein
MDTKEHKWEKPGLANARALPFRVLWRGNAIQTFVSIRVYSWLEMIG